MGYKIACAAVARVDAQKLREALGLAQTDEVDEYMEAPFCAAEGLQDTYIVWKNTADGDFSKVERKNLMENVDCWTFGVHEGVMSGHVDRIESGQSVWRIEYIGCEDPKEFLTFGDVPNSVLQAYAALEQKKDPAHVDYDEDVDYSYEILGQTFASICGLKYDEQSEGSLSQFLRLDQKNPPKKKPFWKIF